MWQNKCDQGFWVFWPSFLKTNLCFVCKKSGHIHMFIESKQLNKGLTDPAISGNNQYNSIRSVIYTNVLYLPDEMRG